MMGAVRCLTPMTQGDHFLLEEYDEGKDSLTKGKNSDSH